ncbi:amidohydrolase family protein [Solwaraspora sp. WMMA2080]|uniref:amidohydrolase n=1 Tax=unclassified Solwaraspora TaxID=2627926 RepID=UPI00248C0984|nr:MULTISPECIES: amidohydrolase family protein [unclassified Solwaraspora]WBB99508.1 amidohydrolase family protein [Solwaraspora sp. WMMA2059]WBC21942.1 amidohydrolase family protein [Solwaraspora sp. WMMA2080]
MTTRTVSSEAGLPVVLYRGGRLYCPAVPGATALLVRDGRIGWLGADTDAPTADVVVDLAGALVTPAFVDAHVHATDTGLVLSGLDLSSVRSPAELVDRVAGFAAGLPPDAVVLGHGWDESTWQRPVPPDARQLSAASGGRRVYLSQASIHSALVSSEMLAAVPGLAERSDPPGWVREDDHHAVRAVAFGSLTPAQRAAAQRAALAAAAGAGIAAVHECGGPQTSSESDFVSVLAMSGDGLPEVYGYWGEFLGAARARELGAVAAGGDLYADGALGSRTAYLSQPYVDGGGCGSCFLDADQVAAHLVDCVRSGVQGGFHAIGDAAVAAVVDGFAVAAGEVGMERLRAGRHRVEHVELVDKRVIGAFVEFGVVASVQPAFDRLWGGEGQMYAARLGVDRALASNPFGALHGVGVTLAFGSDSPVTPLDPWGGVRAAVSHFNPASRLAVRSAFAAHTRGGWRALPPGVVQTAQEGALALGAAATFAVWETPAGVSADGLPVLVAEDPALRGPADPTPLPRCLRTVLRGREIFVAADRAAAGVG